MPDAHEPVCQALHSSYDLLARVVDGLGTDDLLGPSYDDAWSIAQVLSHLGSGAEIFTTILEAGLAGREAPSTDTFPAIWDRWNAMDGLGQVAAWRRSETAFLGLVDDIGARPAQSFRLEQFGMELDLAGFLRLRLSEHALHTWDVAVAVDPAAVVDQQAVHQLADAPVRLAGHVGQPDGRRRRVAVHTTDPDGQFELDTADTIALRRVDSPSGTGPADGAPGAAGDHPTLVGSLDAPAEALLRLVTGRLDPDHTPPAVHATGIGLQELRALFPRF